MDENTRKERGVTIPRLVTRGYSFTSFEIKIISAKAAMMGEISESAALRSIVREWANDHLSGQRIAITPAGQAIISQEVQSD